MSGKKQELWNICITNTIFVLSDNDINMFFFNPKLPRNIMAFNNLINLLRTGVNFVEYNFLKGFSELFVNPKNMSIYVGFGSSN